MSNIILPETKQETKLEFKLMLGCMMNDSGELQLHVNSTDEALLALALRKLSQAVDVRMLQESRKAQMTGIQIAKANDVISRMRQ